MNYRSVADLNDAIRRWSTKLPRDIALIVGIPRSGLLAASMLALHRNLPLTDLEGLVSGRLIATGRRGEQLPTDLTKIDGRIFIVDDSVLTGAELKRVRSRLLASGLAERVEFAAVYVTHNSKHLVDHWYEITLLPRAFEWNMFHHAFLDKWCVDIDGVLCSDPQNDENDDGDRYLNFLIAAEPRYIPTKEVGWLVTSRLEKYRTETEAWLRNHGVRYRQLIMMDHPTMEARRAAGNHAQYKAQAYRKTRATLFIESSEWQARKIVELTGKSVFCTDTWSMVQPKLLSSSLRQPRATIKRTLNQFSLGRGLLRVYGRLVGT